MTSCSQNCPQTLIETQPGFTAQVTRMLTEWLQELRLRRSLRRERASLASLSSRQLDDIGIDRVSADCEAKRHDIPLQRKHLRIG